MENIIFDIGIIVIVATVIGYLFYIFKQPLIPAYIITGMLIGPVLGIIKNQELIMILSEIGIAFLLFGVGLELDLKKLRDIGKVASVGAVIQMAILFFIGVGIALILGWTGKIPIYVGIILAFSSTMVVIKILSDKSELDTLHGRIIIGILLMQDLVAVFALSILQSFDIALIPIVKSIMQALVVILLAVFVSKYIFPRLFKIAAKSQEVLFFLAVTVCFIFSLLFFKMGLSIAIGAFIGGVTLGNLPYHFEIAAKIRSLKDFFGILFFVSIGILFAYHTLVKVWILLIILLAISVILVPIVIMMVCSMFGYKRKTAFMTGVSLAQVSEFTLILVIQGKKLGHLGDDILAITIALTIITIIITAYLIKYDDKLYKLMKNPLKIFERLSKVDLELSHQNEEKVYQTILVGYDRIGFSIFKTLERMKKDFLVVDFNPDVVKKLISMNIPCLYGDISDTDILQKLNLRHVKLLISTIPDVDANMLLIQKLKHANADSNIIVTAFHTDDALDLYDAGADYVIVPHFLGGEHVSILLEEISDSLDRMLTRKLEHIKALRGRKERHPHHK